MKENKSEKEVPVGLAMSLAMNEFAMDYYAGLDMATKKNINNYVQNCSTGEEAKDKIDTAIYNLARNNINFLD